MSTLLLVGCGKMGGAMLRGWLDAPDAPRSVHVVDPSDAACLALPRNVAAVAAAAELPDSLSPGVVVLAVKPQMMDAVLPSLGRFVAPGTVFLSIAAGKTIAYFRRRLGAEARVVRAMPNTPSAVGRGVSVLVAGPDVDAPQRQACDALMRAVGTVEWLEDEALLDPVTAVSGGGPAYVFLLIECLARAGERAGLPADLSMRIARETVSGAGELVRRSPESAEQLRVNVTSPKGTTERALAVLMAEDGLQPLFNAAIAAATERSRDLAS